MKLKGHKKIYSLYLALKKQPTKIQQTKLYISILLYCINLN